MEDISRLNTVTAAPTYLPVRASRTFRTTLHCSLSKYNTKSPAFNLTCTRHIIHEKDAMLGTRSSLHLQETCHSRKKQKDPTASPPSLADVIDDSARPGTPKNDVRWSLLHPPLSSFMHAHATHLIRGSTSQMPSAGYSIYWSAQPISHFLSN